MALNVALFAGSAYRVPLVQQPRKKMAKKHIARDISGPTTLALVRVGQCQLRMTTSAAVVTTCETIQ